MPIIPPRRPPPIAEMRSDRSQTTTRRQFWARNVHPRAGRMGGSLFTWCLGGGVAGCGAGAVRVMLCDERLRDEEPEALGRDA